MRKKTLSLWPWLLAPILAQEPPPIPDATTLQQQFNAAQTEWTKRLAAATKQRDQEALARLQGHRPEAEFLPKFQAGATAHVGTEAAVPYLAFLVSRGDTATSLQAMTTLMQDHVTSAGIGLAVARIGGLKQGYGVDRSRQWLDAVLQHNQDAAVLAQAHFTRAAMYVGTRAVATSDELRQLAVADLRAAQQCLDAAERAKAAELVGHGLPAEAARAQAKKLLGNSLGGLCADLLDEAQRLEPGMQAPEIEGVDLDGVAFKLSDYKGKVVMLDFWGDW